MRQRVADYGIWQNAKQKTLESDGLGVQIRDYDLLALLALGNFLNLIRVWFLNL